VRRPWSVLVCITSLSVLGWSSCRSSPQPEVLFAEAEGLRQTYEKEASHKAINKYREAIVAWEHKGQGKDAAKGWQRVGMTYLQLGALHDSLLSYQAALDGVEGASDLLFESEIRSDVGIAQSYAAATAGVLEEARGQCQRALAQAREAGGKREIAKALTCLGEVSYAFQDTGLSLENFREAETLFEALRDELGQAQIYLHQGHVYSDLGNLDQAEAYVDRAQALWTRLGNKREQAIAKVAKARLEERRGNYQAALNQFQEALNWLDSIGDTVWQGSSLAGIAWVYLEMGEAVLALRHWERALNLFDEAGLKIFTFDPLLHLGATYLASGDDTLALSRFERALALAEETGIERFQAWALRSIGVVQLVRRRADEARRFLVRASEIQQKVGDPVLDRKLRADLGEAHDLRKEYDVALKYLNEALAMSRTASDRVTEARALFGLARASFGSNDLDKARAHIERALAAAESLRTAVENRDLRASYVASVYAYHEFHVALLARLDNARPGEGFSAKAFEASERARARSLIESLTESGVDLRAGVDSELLRREQEAKLAFEKWEVQSRGTSHSATRKADAQRLATEYRDLEERYAQIQAEIKSRSPRYAALARPEPLTLKQIQQQVLDRDTVLLEYALGEERSYVWAVSDKAHRLHELPGRAAIEGAAQRVYERLVERLESNGNEREREASIRQADDEYWPEAARLSDMLIGPVAKEISGKRLLVVTDGMLQYVPFQALPVPGRSTPPVPMLVEHEIVNLPSASVLAVLRQEAQKRVQPSKVVAVFADPVFEADDPRLRARVGPGRSAMPDTVLAQTGVGTPTSQTLRSLGFLRDGSWAVPRLAATRLEAAAIAATVPAGMAFEKTGFDANRATAQGPELAKYRIVHFATHGVFDNENPGLSGLILSLYDERGQPQDGFLRLHDIYNLKLPADLIVLSACNTALGKQVKGEGLMGMVRGFLYAGGQRVVASLWKVDDEATGELMKRFYVEMLQMNRSPAAALRAAQIAMWQQDRWSAPFYWAAFSMQGEWR
jgi:CHAT domain-containing protein/predicted negative regulator of RcsB-dependent stress response